LKGTVMFAWKRDVHGLVSLWWNSLGGNTVHAPIVYVNDGKYLTVSRHKRLAGFEDGVLRCGLKWFCGPACCGSDIPRLLVICQQ
jgi:hypothetical protein